MRERGQPISHGTTGVFSELDPMRRLAITHLIDFVPGIAPYESRAVAEFFPSGGRVRMVITLDAMHDAYWTKMATEGWTSQLTKLDRRLAAA